jgi:hypothetical protein
MRTLLQPLVAREFVALSLFLLALQLARSEQEANGAVDAAVLSNQLGIVCCVQWAEKEMAR